MEDIFILRHSEAEELKDDDFNRKLTEEGIKKTKKLSTFFNHIEEEIDLVLTSPYIRAKETAEFFISNLAVKADVKVVDFLKAGASAKEISKGLLPYSSYKKVVIVGHAPDLEIFLGKLISAERIKLKKGALAKITLNNQIELSGELVWLVIPKIIKKIKTKEIKEKSGISLQK